ncbi:hypothetical protein DB346_18760 [Verrucomicrobia bacterium LW23]|nr:hypothetical protein DB346_18760 [Verrucomicrobia bacterium LW23]
MAAKYYISTDGNSVEGPYAAAAVATLLRQGKIVSDTMVCPDGTEDWAPLNSVPELSSLKEIAGQLGANATTVTDKRSLFASADRQLADQRTQAAEAEAVSAYAGPDVPVSEFRQQAGGEEGLYFFEVMAWVLVAVFLLSCASFGVCYMWPWAWMILLLIAVVISLICVVMLVLAAVEESMLWMFVILLVPFGDIIFACIYPGKTWHIVAMTWLVRIMLIIGFFGSVFSPANDPAFQKAWAQMKDEFQRTYMEKRGGGDSRSNGGGTRKPSSNEESEEF